MLMVRSVALSWNRMTLSFGRIKVYNGSTPKALVQGKESRTDSEGSWQCEFLTSIKGTEEVVCVQEQCRGWPLNSLCDRKLLSPSTGFPPVWQMQRRQSRLQRAVREDGWRQTNLLEQTWSGMKYLFGRKGVQSGATALPRPETFLT